jgi:AbrB family looped-hinge helix DNA binding protein
MKQKINLQEELETRFIVPIHAKGKITLPSVLRHSLKLSDGDKLIVAVDKNDVITLRSLKEIVNQSYGMFCCEGRSVVEELITERRNRLTKIIK